jgi:hypothetical protein
MEIISISRITIAYVRILLNVIVNIAKCQNYHFVIFEGQKKPFFDAKLPGARKKRRNSGVDKTRFVNN